jgi:hypothetical protein
MQGFKINYSEMAMMYYLEYNGNYRTWSTAQALGMTKMKFISILKKCGAIRNKCSGEFYFQHETNAKCAIDILETHVIMN